MLDTRAARKAIREGLNLKKMLEAIPNSREIARQLHLPYFKLFIGVLASGWKNAMQLAYMANAFKAIRIATEDGDLTEGVLPVGQVTGLIKDNPRLPRSSNGWCVRLRRLRRTLLRRQEHQCRRPQG